MKDGQVLRVVNGGKSRPPVMPEGPRANALAWHRELVKASVFAGCRKWAVSDLNAEGLGWLMWLVHVGRCRLSEHKGALVFRVVGF